MPAWPLSEPTAVELEAWRQLWVTPQAVMWERLGWLRTVARYCRVMVEAERPRASAAKLMVVAQLEDKLGLTPKAMRLLLWEVAVDEVAERKQEQQADSARRRIRPVDKAAEGG